MQLIRQMKKCWNEENWRWSIHPVMSFDRNGLVLGAGTVLAARDPAAEDANRLDPDTDATRLITLLSVAYDFPVPESTLGHISRAARQWERGEECLAAIHLAFTGLTKLDRPREAARRLFIADGLLKHGISARTILKAVEIDPRNLDILRKFDEDELRVPPGDGRESGRWTTGAGTSGDSFLADLPKSALKGIDRAYEDFMKARLNPNNPTPHGMAYTLPNPEKGGKPVYYDDCQQSTGMMAEYKGTNYARLLDRTDPESLQAIRKMVAQANNQVEASRSPDLTWFFAEEPVAIKMREVFGRYEKLNKIRVVYQPFEDDPE